MKLASGGDFSYFGRLYGQYIRVRKVLIPFIVPQEQYLLGWLTRGLDKLQAYRIRTLEYEFCMGCQIWIDDLQKFYSRPFLYDTKEYIRDTSHGIRGTFVLTKKADVSEAVHRYTPVPPVPCFIAIMREYYDWVLMSFFTKDKVSGAWTVYFLKKQLKDQEERVISASSYGLMA